MRLEKSTSSEIKIPSPNQSLLSGNIQFRSSKNILELNDREISKLAIFDGGFLGETASNHPSRRSLIGCLRYLPI